MQLHFKKKSSQGNIWTNSNIVVTILGLYYSCLDTKFCINLKKKIICSCCKYLEDDICWTTNCLAKWKFMSWEILISHISIVCHGSLYIHGIYHHSKFTSCVKKSKINEVPNIINQRTINNFYIKRKNNWHLFKIN